MMKDGGRILSKAVILAAKNREIDEKDSQRPINALVVN
jgi:hypothetical protein